MEKMPYRADLDMAVQPSVGDVASTEWQRGLPVLEGRQVVLRELRCSDAAALCALLTSEEVSRFISPPPTTVDGFERFIAWTQRQRAAGAYVCFAVTLRGFDTAIGLFQVRKLDTRFDTAEWGFAIGSAFWGTGVFEESAQLVVDFSFDVVGANRLEARSAMQNGRGLGALLKIGAVQEGVLRKSFIRERRVFDQALFAILAGDWRARRSSTAPLNRIH